MMYSLTDTCKIFISTTNNLPPVGFTSLTYFLRFNKGNILKIIQLKADHLIFTIIIIKLFINDLPDNIESFFGGISFIINF